MNSVHPQVTAGTALLIGELAAINARFNVAAALAAKFATAKPVCRFAYHGGKLGAGYVAKHQHLMARAERAERIQLLDVVIAKDGGAITVEPISRLKRPGLREGHEKG